MAILTIYYYNSQSDALNNNNDIYTQIDSYTVQTHGGYTSWKIASNSTGTSTPSEIVANIVYNTGDTLNANGMYLLYPAVPTINYYPSLTDAINYTNIYINNIKIDSLYVVAIPPIGSITQWKIASNSYGDFNTTVIYTNETLASNYSGGLISFYNLYPASVPCFLEGTNILCQVDGMEKYIPIETIRKDTIVKTLNGFKKVALIGKRDIYNPGNDERTENRLYKCSKYNLKDELFITGYHSILVDNLTEEQREKTMKYMGDIYVTEGKYRLIACIDDRSEPWNSEGTYTIWHFALENPDDRMNYGVYANELLVESCSINYLTNKSNMTLV